MQTTFAHAIHDSIKLWPSSVVRVAGIEVFDTRVTSYKLQVGADDSYKRVDPEPEDDGTPIPDAVTYSAEYWPGYELKQSGWPGQIFNIEGESVIKIDMSNDELKAQWDNFQGTVQETIVHLAQWHFKNVASK